MLAQSSSVAAVCDHRSGRTAVTDRRYSSWCACLLPWVLLLIACPGLSALDSEPAPLASRSLLLDVARAGQRLVAVGDRGHVLLSADEGLHWQQIIVPTRAMLTGVSFGDAKHGWAVGHEGVILATTDGGLTWKRQDNGNDADTIYLDVFFSDALHGLAVGAYGKCILTMDGGKTWQPAAAIPDEVHINQIAPTETDQIYLVGESGTLLTSRDARTGWKKLNVPYEGSLYGLLYINEHAILAYGLRGHVFSSSDNGAGWLESEMTAPVLIMAGIRLHTGLIVLAGAGGNFFSSGDLGQSFFNWKPNDYKGGVSAMIETTDGVLLVVGELGAGRVDLPP